MWSWLTYTVPCMKLQYILTIDETNVSVLISSVNHSLRTIIHLILVKLTLELPLTFGKLSPFHLMKHSIAIFKYPPTSSFHILKY